MLQVVNLLHYFNQIPCVVEITQTAAQKFDF